MAEATIDGTLFRIDPENISWSFEVDIEDFPTVGGKIVQILGVRDSTLTISGSFGLGGYQEQDAFLARMKELARSQVGGISPSRFIYPSRGWDFLLLLSSYSNPRGSRSARYGSAGDETNLKWSLTWQIVKDNADLKSVAVNNYINRISKGLGWDKPNLFNGPLEVDGLVVPEDTSVPSDN